MALPVTRTIQDPDFWWHLRAGQLIIQHGGLLGNDPFTYTVANHHWTMHEWLNEVLFAIEFTVGGLGLIVLMLSAVTWLGLLAIMQKARLRNPGRGVLGIGMLIAVIAGFPIWGPRVQMITFAFSALTLLLVERHWCVAGGRYGCSFRCSCCGAICMASSSSDSRSSRSSWSRRSSVAAAHARPGAARTPHAGAVSVDRRRPRSA